MKPQFFLVLVTMMLWYANTSIAQGSGITPWQAVDIAYHDRSLLQANIYQIDSAYKETSAIFSLLFPQILINTTYSKLRPGSLGNFTADISIEQLLFSFDGPLQDYFIARKTVDIAKDNELLNRDAVRFELETSLLNLWNIKYKENTIRALDTSSIADFERGKNRDTVGFLNTTQYDDVKAVFEENLATVFGYKDEYAQSEAVFERAIGIHHPTALDPLAVEMFIARSIEKSSQFQLPYWKDRAYTHRKELLIKDDEIEQIELVKKKAWGRYIPSATMFVTLIEPRSFVDFSFEGPFLSSTGVRISPLIWNVGVRFQWTFDSFAGVHQAEADEFSKLAKIMEKREMISEIKEEVEVAYYGLQQLLLELKAQKERFQASESAFAEAKKRYEVGMISRVDFIDAQTTWEQAKFDLESVEVQVAQKYRELLYRAGYPDEPISC